MSGEIVRPGEGSPFDAVRRVDANGRETWDARDLQRPLGYDKWERFEDAIDRAITSARISGDDRGFSRVREQPRTGGRPRVTYILDRQAAYLVAMNGDVRKPEIAAAQAYFAIRTQEAEAAASAATEIDLIIASAQAIKRMQAQLAQAETRAIEAAQDARAANARIDAMEGRHNWFSALGYAKENGMPTDSVSLARFGKVAASIARAEGIEPNKVQHAHFGKVNEFPLHVWDRARDALGGAA